MYFYINVVLVKEKYTLFNINLKLLSGNNTQKVNKQNIRDLQNWVFDELNEIIILNQSMIDGCR